MIVFFNNIIILLYIYQDFWAQLYLTRSIIPTFIVIRVITSSPKLFITTHTPTLFCRSDMCSCGGLTHHCFGSLRSEYISIVAATVACEGNYRNFHSKPNILILMWLWLSHLLQSQLFFVYRSGLGWWPHFSSKKISDQILGAWVSFHIFFPSLFAYCSYVFLC